MRPDPKTARGVPALETASLSKAYGPHVVLRDVSVSVDPGTIAVVSGANGTGKSTLLRCLAGLIAFEGSASVAGVPIDGRREARALVGYMPQSVSLPENVTVGEVLAFFAKLRGIPATEPSELPEGFLPAPERPIGILSGGQRQRVALAVALLGRPALLLLDEPVANLDEGGREGFWETLRRFSDEGVASLIASPMPSDLAGIADRAIVLDDGEVAFDGPMGGPHAVPLIRAGDGRPTGAAPAGDDGEEARA